MDYRSLLNENQYEAVSTAAQYVRIIAGAGSGKTRVLTYRISYLIGELHVDPRRILAIAFTNKVAKEMKERAGKIVPEVAHLVSVSTFHAFCARFLRMEASAIGFPVSFTIFDEDDQGSLVKEICVGRGYKKGDSIIKEALSYIRRKKTEGKYPQDISLSLNARHTNEKEILEIFEEYEERKNAMFALDFDDLLLKTIFVLSEFDAIRHKWQNRYDHILVDEFQDTNDVQYKLMCLLIRDDTCLYVVGDPDQTIYTWRGANQKIILGFNESYQGLETIILDRNYRSTDVILNAANRLIAHNKKRIPKNLYTTEKNGAPIEAYKGVSAEAEAKWVADRISSIARKNGGDYSNIAVLYRSSYVTRPFESEFAARGIAYRIFGGLRFYQRMEVKDVLAYFRLLVNEKDDVSFDRIVNVPRRGIGESSLEIIKEEAKQAGLSEYEYVKSLDAEKTALKTRVNNALNAMVMAMESTKKKLSDNYEVYSATLRDFVMSIKYFDYLTEDQNPDEDRIANVNALFDDINHYINNNPDSTFEQYLQNVSLLTSQDDMNGGNYVSLMTIHVAKGLEFDNVFVIAMNEGTFPSDRARMEGGRDAEEEERRLAYVAMTRARKNLYLSCNSSYSYVTDSAGAPSMFMKEAGVELPPDQDHNLWGATNWRSNGSRFRGTNNGWRKVAQQSSSSFFEDGDAIDPFEKPKPKPEPERPANNGINDWRVGDIAIHEKFGEGVVTSVLNGSIIVVEFKEQGKKTLLASHPLLSRKASKGGLA